MLHHDRVGQGEQSALRKTVVSEAFDEFMKCKKKPKSNQPSYFSFTKGLGLSHHALGKLTKQCVLSDKFWEDADAFLTITADFYKGATLDRQQQPHVRQDLSAHVQTHREPTGQRIRDR